ncbi:MAG: menaquinone biosynthesis protein [Nitrospirota bacterium]
MKLRIGEISYTNLFPIFYMLRKECDCSGYEFIEGTPSALNKKIREGDIDISPSSSIEYLRYPDRYKLIENHSISSTGPIGSILLFSRRPIETLNGLTVLTSSQSETSVALLRIILKKFYELECPLKSTSARIESAIRSNTAYLLIGDEALAEALKWPRLYIYDLGDLWHKNTGLPFTFALWIANSDCYHGKSELLRKFTDDLNRSKASALKNLKAIAGSSPLVRFLSEDELVSYWKGISYDFNDEHKKGLELFRRYSEEIGLL